MYHLLSASIMNSDALFEAEPVWWINNFRFPFPLFFLFFLWKQVFLKLVSVARSAIPVVTQQDCSTHYLGSATFGFVTQLKILIPGWRNLRARTILVHSKQWSRLSSIFTFPYILPQTTILFPHLTWLLSLTHLWTPRPNLPHHTFIHWLLTWQHTWDTLSLLLFPRPEMYILGKCKDPKASLHEHWTGCWSHL